MVILSGGIICPFILSGCGFASERPICQEATRRRSRPAAIFGDSLGNGRFAGAETDEADLAKTEFHLAAGPGAAMLAVAITPRTLHQFER
jgi:hypothetical protein